MNHEHATSSAATASRFQDALEVHRRTGLTSFYGPDRDACGRLTFSLTRPGPILTVDAFERRRSQPRSPATEVRRNRLTVIQSELADDQRRRVDAELDRAVERLRQWRRS